jgi:hypothetical protein
MDFLLYQLGLIGNDDCRRGFLLDAIFTPGGEPLAAHLLEAFAMADRYATADDLRRPRLQRRRSFDAVRYADLSHGRASVASRAV